LDNILGASDRKGQATTSTYDALNRLSTAAYADGSTLSYTYDLGNRITQLQDSLGGTITRVYDGLDRLTSETTAQGTVTYGYDDASRLTSIQAPGQSQASYGYDNANRLTGITQGSISVVYAYDADSRRTSATLPTGIVATYGYDVASELTSLSYANGSTTLGNLTYAYDNAGNVASRGGTLFQSILPGAVTSAAYDAANRLTSRTVAGVTVTPTFDANGSLTNDGANAYTWDARNRLQAIGSLASYVYDGTDRRVSATRSGTTTSFLYAGNTNNDVVQEQQGGTASANLLLGLGTDERLSRASETYLTDMLGSTVALASGTAIQTNYGYDPYGVAQTTGTASTNAFQYTGREADAAGLMYYRARYYNPALGRFISEDPIGFAGGGPNFYAYVQQNPELLTDPEGKNVRDWRTWVRICTFIICGKVPPNLPPPPKKEQAPISCPIDQR
jgi:RHS repeat-associated protein